MSDLSIFLRANLGTFAFSKCPNKRECHLEPARTVIGTYFFSSLAGFFSSKRNSSTFYPYLASRI
jgi:hypothetical protein